MIKEAGSEMALPPCVSARLKPAKKMVDKRIGEE
jgi:hypothetical protein